MNTLSKSPVYVAREALAVGCKALRPYSNKFSPKFYTQPQLFCCLVLKTFFKLDYRGVADRQRVRSFMPAKIGRPTSKPPSGRYRRQMKRRLNKHYGSYGQRWQVECTNSMLKRCLATTVQARSYWAQCRELLLLVLTYQVMLRPAD